MVDSRAAEDGTCIRRRRECLECSTRFTTFERLEEVAPVVIKRDGRRVPFERAKIESGVRAACKGRPVDDADIEALASEVEEKVKALEEGLRSRDSDLAQLRELRDALGVAVVTSLIAGALSIFFSIVGNRFNPLTQLVFWDELAPLTGGAMDVERMTYDDKLALLFEAGVSTAPALTETSGRGIGLHAVRDMVTAAGGAIAVRSGPDGTRFEISLPATLTEVLNEGGTDE